MKLCTLNEFRNSSPALRNLAEHLDQTFSITAMNRLYYQGVIAGSEFLTYAATKLYLLIEANFSTNAFTYYIQPGALTFYNELNVVSDFMVCSNAFYNTGTAQVCYSIDNKGYQNNYFSRIVAQSYNYIKFNGYRLTIA